jgi:hypothetical protein
MSLNREFYLLYKWVCPRNLRATSKPQPQQGFCLDLRDLKNEELLKI